jgi:hypothetical protein
MPTTFLCSKPEKARHFVVEDIDDGRGDDDDPAYWMTEKPTTTSTMLVKTDRPRTIGCCGRASERQLSFQRSYSPIVGSNRAEVYKKTSATLCAAMLTARPRYPKQDAKG